MKKRFYTFFYILITILIIIGIILVLRPYIIEQLQIIRTNRIIENFENGQTIVSEDKNDIVSILLKILGEYEGSGYDTFSDDDLIELDYFEEDTSSIGNLHFSNFFNTLFPPAYASENDNELAVIGKIEIPAFGKHGINAIMNQSTTQALKLGVCHLEGTAMPGELGNCVILGHRTSNQFYHANCFVDVENYDKRIFITDSNGYTYLYEASSHKSVSKNDVWKALDEYQFFDHQLTLLTCSPKTPPEGQRRNNRLLVFCNLIEVIPPTDENVSSD